MEGCLGFWRYVKGSVRWDEVCEVRGISNSISSKKKQKQNHKTKENKKRLTAIQILSICTFLIDKQVLAVIFGSLLDCFHFLCRPSSELRSRRRRRAWALKRSRPGAGGLYRNSMRCSVGLCWNKCFNKRVESITSLHFRKLLQTNRPKDRHEDCLFIGKLILISNCFFRAKEKAGMSTKTSKSRRERSRSNDRRRSR